MSEESRLFDATFNRTVKIRARDHRLTSDAGVVLLREADHRLGLIESVGARLFDPRRQDLIRYSVTELLRERLFTQALGYNADDDVDLLAHDPAMRMASWDRPGEQVLDERLGSQPTQSRLIDILANSKRNRAVLGESLAEWVGRHVRASGDGRALMRATLDIDSFPLEVYGSQDGAGYNGYYRRKIYHPLVAGLSAGGDFDSRRLGDGLVHARLREGHVDSADGAVEFIRETIARSRQFARSVDVRFDAAFAEGPIMDALSDEGIRFVGRLRSSPLLEDFARPHVSRPPGRPPKEGYEKVLDLLWHHPEPWKHPQRIVLVVIDKPDPKTGQLELFPHYFFLVTNWRFDEKTPEEILEDYRRRGTFEDRIGEFKNAVVPHLSSPRFEENEVRLYLSLLTFNLLSILRGELESTSPNGWGLERLQRTVLKTGGRITRGARRLTLDVALAAVALWERLLRRLARWVALAPEDQPRGPRRRRWVPPPSHAHLSAVLRE